MLPMANWDRLTRQGNVTDRRGAAAGGLGVVGVIIVVGISMLTGADPLATLSQLEQQGMLTTGASPQNAQQFEGMDDYERFSSLVVGSLDAYWEQHAPGYTPAKLVLFRDATSSGCGGASTYAGPHYCPVDATIYLDERFFEQLSGEFGAQGGDVAQAYVIAHEAGHHVQDIMNRLPDDESSEASIATELAADCLAGAWLGSPEMRDIYEQNEIYEALDAASAVGDDNIQKRTQGTVQPESWTHGSSAERKQSLMRGYESSDDPSVCLNGGSISSSACSSSAFFSMIFFAEMRAGRPSA
jgi:predicted metalloprotease